MHGDPQILFIVIIALCHALQISYVCHRVHREHMRELRFEDRVLQHHGRCGEPSDALLSGSTRFIYRPGQLVRISVRACAIGWILRGVCAPVFAVEGVEYGRDCCGGVGWLQHGTRVAFRRHTIIQVLAGFGFGVLVFRLLHSWVRS